MPAWAAAGPKNLAFAVLTLEVIRGYNNFALNNSLDAANFAVLGESDLLVPAPRS
jgi:hypothetical protein